MNTSRIFGRSLLHNVYNIGYIMIGHSSKTRTLLPLSDYVSNFPKRIMATEFDVPNTRVTFVNDSLNAQGTSCWRLVSFPLVLEEMEVVVESQKTGCSLLLITALLFAGFQVIFLVTTILVSSCRFFLAWNHIHRLNRPASLLQSAVATFVYRRAKRKQSPSEECPICLSEYGQSWIRWTENSVTPIKSRTHNSFCNFLLQMMEISLAVESSAFILFIVIVFSVGWRSSLLVPVVVRISRRRLPTAARRILTLKMKLGPGCWSTWDSRWIWCLYLELPSCT